MNAILALDFGTQGAKAALLEENGRMSGPSYSAYGFAVNEGGRLEQDPGHWWKACVEICALLREQFPEAYRNICGVSVTGQMHGMVPVTASGRPLYHSIVWCDTRSEAQTKELAALPEPLLQRMVNTPSSAYSAPKLLWLKRHCPEILEQSACLLYCKDYIRYHLTGQFATDHSDASGSLLYDFESGFWDVDLISSLGLPAGSFPTVLSSTDHAGVVLPEAAKLLGIPAGIPVAVGAGDLACSILGCGLTGEQQILVNLGTAGQVMALSHEARRPPSGCHLFQFPVAGLYITLASLQSAAYCLRWFAENIDGVKVDGTTVFQEMLQLAGQAPVGAGGLLFTPYLSGTGTPYSDSDARASFIGLDAAHYKSHMLRAILEGVCFGIRDCVFALRPDRSGQVFFTGGGAKSPLWQSIMADVLGMPVSVPQNPESTVLGAAAIGSVQAGFFSDVTSAVKSISSAAHLLSDPLNQTRYDALYRIYQKAYASQKEVLKELSKLRT